MPLLTATMLLHLVLAAALYDLREWRIPNALTACGTAAGIVSVWLLKGTDGFPQMLLGAVIPLLLPGILFLFRMIGAGDIKLLSMIGVFLGPEGTVRVIWFTFLFGAAVSAVKLFRRRALLLRFRRLGHFLMAGYRTGHYGEYIRDMSRETAGCHHRLNGSRETVPVSADSVTAAETDSEAQSRVHLAVCILAAVIIQVRQLV